MEHDLHPRDSRSKTVAWFSSNDQVRAATVALERHGIDSMYIDVARPPSVSDRRRIDRSSMSWMGRRAAMGAAIGAVVGVLIGLALGMLFDAEGVDLFGAVIGAVIFLTPIGGFLALVTRLPVTEEAFDTFGDEPEGLDWVSISGPKDVQDTARAVLQSLDPVRIERVRRRRRARRTYTGRVTALRPDVSVKGGDAARADEAQAAAMANWRGAVSPAGLAASRGSPARVHSMPRNEIASTLTRIPTQWIP